MGIYDLIQMSRIDIPTNASLLATTTYFWSFSLNCFIFKSGWKPSPYMTWLPYLASNLMGRRSIQFLWLIICLSILVSSRVLTVAYSLRVTTTEKMGQLSLNTWHSYLPRSVSLFLVIALRRFLKLIWARPQIWA